MCDFKIQIFSFPYIKILNIIRGRIDHIGCFKKLRYFEATSKIKTNEVILRNCSQSNLITLYQQKRGIYEKLIHYITTQGCSYHRTGEYLISAELKIKYKY